MYNSGSFTVIEGDVEVLNDGGEDDDDWLKSGIEDISSSKDFWDGNPFEEGTIWDIFVVWIMERKGLLRNNAIKLQIWVLF